jgi:hypothetical protein
MRRLYIYRVIEDNIPRYYARLVYTGAAMFVVVAIGGVLTVSLLGSSVVEAVEQADQTMSEQKQAYIVKRSFCVKEGKGKPAYIADHSVLSHETAQSVMRRQDDITVWESGRSTFAVIEHNIPSEPTSVHLSLERDGELHVFSYEPADCDQQQREGVLPETCTNVPLAEADQTYRALFDASHDLQELYASAVSALNDPISYESGYRYLGKKRYEGTVYHIVRRHVSDDMFVDTFLDLKTNEKQLQKIYIVKEDRAYEMAEVGCFDHELTSQEEFATLFNPQAFAFEKRGVVAAR